MPACGSGAVVCSSSLLFSSLLGRCQAETPLILLCRFPGPALGYDKTKNYLWELIAGYGVKPGRVLICLSVLFGLVSTCFSYLLGSIEQGLLFSAGAFLTF